MQMNLSARTHASKSTKHKLTMVFPFPMAPAQRRQQEASFCGFPTTRLSVYTPIDTTCYHIKSVIVSAEAVQRSE